MLLSIYPNKLELYVHINNCSGMIQAALFIMVESPRADILECDNGMAFLLFMYGCES